MDTTVQSLSTPASSSLSLSLTSSCGGRGGDMMEKTRAHSTITEASSDLDDGDSHCSREVVKTTMRQELRITTSSTSTNTATTAGLFIHNPSEKPLPLSVTRTIPLPRFWKRSNRYNTGMPTTSAPDILRRTGEGTAKFAQHNQHHGHNNDFHAPPSGGATTTSSRRRGRNTAAGTGVTPKEWVCRQCNHGNNSLSPSCALCGDLYDQHFELQRQPQSSSSSTGTPSPVYDNEFRALPAVESSMTATASNRRGPVRRSYSAHVSTTRDNFHGDRRLNAYSRSRSLSDDDFY